jgi:hypothetical protein
MRIKRPGERSADRTFTVEIPMSRNWKAAAAGALAMTLMLAPSAHSQTISCKSLGESLTRNAFVPYHAYITSTAGYNGGKPVQSEIISTGSAMYAFVNGKWQRSPMDAKQMAKMQQEGADSMSMLYTCSRAGSETVNGAAAQRYHIALKTPADGETSEQDIWIDSKGLIRQVVRDADIGSGARGKSHLVMRYDYANVSVPPGVQ